MPCQWLLYLFISSHFAVKPPLPYRLWLSSLLALWFTYQSTHFVECLYDPTVVLLTGGWTDGYALSSLYALRTNVIKTEVIGEKVSKISRKSGKVKTQCWSDVLGSLVCRILPSR